MSYLDIHRKRMFQFGDTPQKRIETSTANDFERSILPNSPNRVKIFYEDGEYDCILASGNSRVGTQTERKVTQYLETTRSLKLPEGATFTTIDPEIQEQLYWIVLHREIHPRYPYFKYKIVELNYKIKYVDEYGQLKEIPVYINGTGEFDIKQYFKFASPAISQSPNRQLNVIMAQNKDFKVENKKRDLKFIIGEEGWHYVDSDRISIPGVYFTTLTKTPVNEQTDDIENKIANVVDLGKTRITSSIGDSSHLIAGLNYPPITFSLLQNDSLATADLSVTTNDTDGLISINRNQIILKDVGECEVYVEDKISKISKVFYLTIESATSNYFFVSGLTSMIPNSQITLEVNTDLEYVCEFNSDRVIVTAESTQIKVKSLKQIGQTPILIKSLSGNIIKEIVINVKNLWM